MNTIAISAKNLSKRYQLYRSPKYRLKEALHPFRKKYHQSFWALRDVSFEVRRGETVGIIGRNGSGKSTLLQIICGTMTPTQGGVETNGRVSALLELGAGFNPEFTGKDNVYLNGAIMGLSRETMDERFEDIVSFADIGDFIDQPVKTYSSGMYVRLAFACAINIDPDILVIDEALSVGDAKFQHKCFNKFIEFQKAGKTILFVSHSSDLIVKHCDYAILLEKGNVVEIGEPKSITNYYLDLLFSGKITGHAHSPVLVESGYRGFNIVHHRMKYYAILQSSGAIDFTQQYENEFQKYIAEHKCIVGSSLEEVKQIVDPAVDSSIPNKEILAAKVEKTELVKFLEEIPFTDNCINRKNYNKNEYRYGGKRAEIVDFLLVSNGQYEPLIVNCNEWLDIYMKVKFNADVENPNFGFKIKTVDGIVVYGTNAVLQRFTTRAVSKNEMIAYKFSLKLCLAAGDYFIDLAVGDKQSNDDAVATERRFDIIHITVQQTIQFSGMVDLECSLFEYLF